MTPKTYLLEISYKEIRAPVYIKKNLQLLAIEMFKAKNGMTPKIIQILFVL